MPIRLIFGLRIGPPKGCFRIAFRPGHLAWHEGFDALERSVADTIAFLRSVDPRERMSILAGELPPPTDQVPRCGNRTGAIDVYGSALPEGPLELVVRASFPFRFWPLGEWVVFDGIYISPDNTARAFTTEEIAETW